jgi:CHASE3 domain sensor protein
MQILNWLKLNDWKIGLGILVLVVIVIVIYYLIKKFKKPKREIIKREIRDSRQQLRNLHKKYQTELFEITNKIDKFLEVIENGNT